MNEKANLPRKLLKIAKIKGMRVRTISFLLYWDEMQNNIRQILWGYSASHSLLPCTQGGKRILEKGKNCKMAISWSEHSGLE